jgi:hypothetical protein
MRNQVMPPTWRMGDGKEIKMSDMQTSHIQNSIRMIERKWDELDHDEYITADHWSLSGVVFVPGREYYGTKLKELRRELQQRLTQTESQTEPVENAPEGSRLTSKGETT